MTFELEGAGTQATVKESFGSASDYDFVLAISKRREISLSGYFSLPCGLRMAAPRWSRVVLGSSRTLLSTMSCFRLLLVRFLIPSMQGWFGLRPRRAHPVLSGASSVLERGRLVSPRYLLGWA